MYDLEKVDQIIEFANEICKTKSKDEAIELLTKIIETTDEKYLNEFISVLNYLQDDRILDWIENQELKIKNVSQSWGQLAASSKFNWKRAEKWIDKGRPLSLIALDALVFCTSNHNRLNQSIWMRELNPKLIETPKSEIIANKIVTYSKIDHAPRVKNKVNQIIMNLFE